MQLGQGLGAKRCESRVLRTTPKAAKDPGDGGGVRKVQLFLKWRAGGQQGRASIEVYGSAPHGVWHRVAAAPSLGRGGPWSSRARETSEQSAEGARRRLLVGRRLSRLPCPWQGLCCWTGWPSMPSRLMDPRLGVEPGSRGVWHGRAPLTLVLKEF